MKGLLRLSEKGDALAVWVGKVGAWTMLPLIAIVIFDVITRKITPLKIAISQSWINTYISSTKLQEWEWHLHTILFLCAFAYAYVENAHVRVDIVREKLPPKGQAWLELIGCLIFLIPYCLLVLWFAWGFVMQAFVSNEGSAAMTGLGNRWIIKSFILMAMVLSIIAGVDAVIRKIAFLFGSTEVSRSVRLHMVSPEAQAKLKIERGEHVVAPASALASQHGV